MKIRVLGGGFYGSHIAYSLLQDGYDVELHEISDRLFSGASGNIPARLHCGSHYPRSKLTRSACKNHYSEFMHVYGDLTRHVPINLYAIAADDSLVDFGTYCDILKNDIEFITVVNTREFGLRNVEGAILTGERHIIVDLAREYFQDKLSSIVKFNTKPDDYEGITIDCTFCARDEQGIDRFELCLTVLLKGPVDKAVTIMDGPFPSLYPWDEERGLCSLTSAKWTPLIKTNTWNDAKSVMEDGGDIFIRKQGNEMVQQMSLFYPSILNDYKFVEDRLAIRAMPRSGCDARLVDVVPIGDKTIRIRAGKIDAIFHAYDIVKSMLCSL